MLTFKEGHMPAVWADFQGCSTVPKNVWNDHVGRPTRCIVGARMSYEDDQGRTGNFTPSNVRRPWGPAATFAWITDLRVQASTVVNIATKGGRARWHIENQGFNRQKNSGFNLEHAFCTNPELLKAYYYLMQIAHMIMQIFEASSLLRQLARECGQTPWQWFGSLKNLARRLLECFRYFALSAAAFASGQAHRIYFQ